MNSLTLSLITVQGLQQVQRALLLFFTLVPTVKQLLDTHIHTAMERLLTLSNLHDDFHRLGFTHPSFLIIQPFHRSIRCS